jgi:hypothetical protein
VIALAVVGYLLVAKHGPVDLALCVKILSFFVGVPASGMVVGMIVLGMLHLITGIEFSRGSETLIDGVWKGDREELGVAKVRHRIEKFSLVLGLVLAALCLYVGLFTEYPLSFPGVYSFLASIK